MSAPRPPNLFDFATKELSQDAMICWLIRWADEQFADVDRQLHDCGRRFVSALLNQHEGTNIPERFCTEVFRQDKSIDVLARIRQDHVLLIEDKTGSSDHSGQLKRYYDHVVDGETNLKEVRKESLYPIYLKTGNQSLSKDRQIESLGGFYRPYRVFNRCEFLDVLRLYKGNHQALNDYREYLEKLEKDTNSYRDWDQRNRCKWSWWSWEGFYRYLELELCTGDWSYVPNAAGGFLGFYWSFIPADGEPHIYLQLEVQPKGRQLLCFKVGRAPKERQQELKWDWNERVVRAGAGTVEKPPVMRAGWTMTVGRWKGEWLAYSDSKVDLDGTVRNLRRAEEILRTAAGMTE